MGTLYTVELSLDNGWEVVERDVDTIVQVAKEIWALKPVNGEYGDGVYSKEQIYKDFDHAVAYTCGDYLFAKEGRYFE